MTCGSGGTRAGGMEIVLKKNLGAINEKEENPA